MHSNRLEIKAAIRKCNASFTAVEQVWTKRDLKGYARFQLVRFISLVSRYRARVRRAREPTPIFKPQTVRKHEWTRLSIYTAIIRGDKQFHISGNGVALLNDVATYILSIHVRPWWNVSIYRYGWKNRWRSIIFRYFAFHVVFFFFLRWINILDSLISW